MRPPILVSEGWGSMDVHCDTGMLAEVGCCSLTGVVLEGLLDHRVAVRWRWRPSGHEGRTSPASAHEASQDGPSDGQDEDVCNHERAEGGVVSPDQPDNND